MDTQENSNTLPDRWPGHCPASAMQAGPAFYGMDYNKYDQRASMDPPSIRDTQPEALSDDPTEWYDTRRESPRSSPFLNGPPGNYPAVNTSFSHQDYNHPSSAASHSPKPHDDTLTTDRATGTVEEWKSWLSFPQDPDPQFATKAGESAHDTDTEPFTTRPEGDGVVSHDTTSPQPSATEMPLNKRKRNPTPCVRCRSRKVACHRNGPTSRCGRCSTENVECVTLATGKTKATTFPSRPVTVRHSRTGRSRGKACTECKSSRVLCCPSQNSSSCARCACRDLTCIFASAPKKKTKPPTFQ